MRRGRTRAKWQQGAQHQQGKKRYPRLGSHLERGIRRELGKGLGPEGLEGGCGAALGPDAAAPPRRL